MTDPIITAADGIHIARPPGTRLDAASAPGFKTAVLDAIAGGADKVVIDMTATSFMDSSGLGSLVSCLKAIGATGQLALAGTNPTVVQLMKLTRLDKVFRTFPTTDAAADALRRGEG